jgi:tetratricopeptide (TPR) repeat protein
VKRIIFFLAISCPVPLLLSCMSKPFHTPTGSPAADTIENETVPGLAPTSLEEGERLFLDNKPQEALPYLEKALYETPKNEQVYLYLGIIYEQLGETEKAVQIFKRGLRVAEQHKDLFYYDLGNVLFKQGEFTLAEQMYTNALDVNGQLHEAYLNRANTRLEMESYSAAREDYITYLRLDPTAPQRENIEKMITMLEQPVEGKSHKLQEELEREKSQEENKKIIEKDTPVLGIMTLVAGEGISKAEASALTDFVYDAVFSHIQGRATLIDRTKRDQILRETEFALSDVCDGTDCAVRFGKFLSADYMVFGICTKFGTNYHIVLRMVDVGTTEIVGSVRSKAETLDGVEATLSSSVRDLVSGTRIGTE